MNNEELYNAIVGRLDSMDSRLDAMDSRLDAMDSKIESLQNDVREIKVVQLENRILPVLRDIIAYQKDTYDRYIKEADTIQTLQADMDTVKQTIIIHSEKFKKLGV